MAKLLVEVEPHYDHVLVECSYLLRGTTEQERFSAVRSALARAHRVVVMASSDPQGAAGLVEWKGAAVTAGISAPCLAVFGRSGGSGYEHQHLANLVESSTGRHPYSDVAFLAEDATVNRARWNGELVWKGRWLRQVHSLAALSVSGAAPNGGEERHRRIFHGRVGSLHLQRSGA